MIRYKVKVFTRSVVISGSCCNLAIASASWTSIELLFWGWLTSNSSSILRVWTRASQEMTRDIQYREKWGYVEDLRRQEGSIGCSKVRNMANDTRFAIVAPDRNSSKQRLIVSICMGSKVFARVSHASRTSTYKCISPHHRTFMHLDRTRLSFHDWEKKSMKIGTTLDRHWRPVTSIPGVFTSRIIRNSRVIASNLKKNNEPL